MGLYRLQSSCSLLGKDLSTVPKLSKDEKNYMSNVIQSRKLIGRPSSAYSFRDKSLGMIDDVKEKLVAMQQEMHKSHKEHRERLRQIKRQKSQLNMVRIVPSAMRKVRYSHLLSEHGIIPREEINGPIVYDTSNASASHLSHHREKPSVPLWHHPITAFDGVSEKSMIQR